MLIMSIGKILSRKPKSRIDIKESAKMLEDIWWDLLFDESRVKHKEKQKYTVEK